MVQITCVERPPVLLGQVYTGVMVQITCVERPPVQRGRPGVRMV